MLFAAIALLPQTAAAQTWYKVVPGACRVWAGSNYTTLDTADVVGGGGTCSGAGCSGTRVMLGVCAVNLPNGVTVNLLRARLNSNVTSSQTTDIELWRQRWDNWVEKMGEVNVAVGQSVGDDATIVSGTINNENFLYYIQFAFTSTPYTSETPGLRMLEIRY